MADPVAVLNQALASIPVAAGYDISADVAGCYYVVTSSDGETASPLRIDVCSTCRQGRTHVVMDSAQTLQKLAGAGQATVFQLVAARRLRIEGDMGQLQALKSELEPHKQAMERAARAAADAASGRSGLQRSASWVPDESAASCMEVTCGRRFQMPFVRRHHCRVCGGVFCANCAPLKLGAQRESRACIGCRRSSALGASFASSDGGLPAAPGGAGASAFGPLATLAQGLSADDGDEVTGAAAPGPEDTLWLLDWQIEAELQSLRFWSRFVLFVILLIPCLVGWYFSANLLAAAKAIPSLHVGLQAALAMVALLLLFLRHMIWRTLRVVWVCAVLIGSLARTSRRSRGANEKGSKAIWGMSHNVHARFLLDAVMDISGFYVKVAQTLSVATAIPEPFHRELSKLQDSMPAEPHSDVEKTLAEEFGKNWRERVRLHPGPPLGSATIAQVHRATLLMPGPDGTVKEVEGVIKVQHRQMRGNLAVDMRAASLLAALLAQVSPVLFDDMADIVREVTNFTKSELDFRNEAESQMKARETALAHGVDIVIPCVFTKFVTSRVFAMEFIDGERMNDFARSARRSEKMRVVHDLIDFFAFSFTQAGIFNCDPHPGNLLITKDYRLCVLDWGQARRLSKREMEAYSLLFCAASLEDPFLLVEAGKQIGLKYEEHAAVSMVQALRFIMRDSRPIQMSKDDIGNLEKMFSRFGQIPELANVKGDSRDVLRGPLLPLSKTVDLLHNVSTRLDVNLSLLQVFTSKGYEHVLRNNTPPGVEAPEIQKASVGFVLQPALLDAASAQASAVDGELRKLLADAHGRGGLLGAQVVILDAATGATISDFAYGHNAYLQGRPVTRSMPFNIGEISKLHMALGVLRLVESGRLRLSTRLGEVWPAARALQDITVEQILSHTTGVVQVFPKGIPEITKLGNLPWMLGHLEKSNIKPLVPPGYKQHYMHYTYGWLLAGALRGVDQDLVSCMALGRRDLAANRDAVQGVLQERDVAELTKEMNSSSIEDMAALFTNVGEFLDVLEKARLHGATEEDKADGEAFMSVHGYSHWLHPGAAQQDGFDSCLLPGVTAYSTARRLAQLLLGVERGEVLRPETLANMKRSRRVPGQREAKLFAAHFSFKENEWGLGAELVKLPSEGSAEGAKAWGHTSSGGSFALVVPGRRPVVAAVLLNRMDGWERGLSKKLLGAVSKFASGGAP